MNFILPNNYTPSITLKTAGKYCEEDLTVSLTSIRGQIISLDNMSADHDSGASQQSIEGIKNLESSELFISFYDTNDVRYCCYLGRWDGNNFSAPNGIISFNDCSLWLECLNEELLLYFSTTNTTSTSITNVTIIPTLFSVV